MIGLNVETNKSLMWKMEEMLPPFNSDVDRCLSRAKEIEHDDLINELDKEFKLPHLKELLVCYYGMQKGETNDKKKGELIALWDDKISSEERNATA